MKLSAAEEELMEIIWEKEQVFMKDILETLPEPKPATTTIATLLKRMQEKGFVGFRQMGNSREYYPLVRKTDYCSGQFKGIMQKFFGNSALRFASFFTTSSDMSAAELEELKKLIDVEIKKKKS